VPGSRGRCERLLTTSFTPHEPPQCRHCGSGTFGKGGTGAERGEGSHETKTQSHIAVSPSLLLTETDPASFLKFLSLSVWFLEPSLLSIRFLQNRLYRGCGYPLLATGQAELPRRSALTVQLRPLPMAHCRHVPQLTDQPPVIPVPTRNPSRPRRDACSPFAAGPTERHIHIGRLSPLQGAFTLLRGGGVPESGSTQHRADASAGSDSIDSVCQVIKPQRIGPGSTPRPASRRTIHLSLAYQPVSGQLPAARPSRKRQLGWAAIPCTAVQSAGTASGRDLIGRPSAVGGGKDREHPPAAMARDMSWPEKRKLAIARRERAALTL